MRVFVSFDERYDIDLYEIFVAESFLPRSVPKLDRRLGRPSAVAKHSAETFMALDHSAGAEAARASIDQLIPEPLMVPLCVIVLDVLADDSPKMTFAERNHLTDSL
jgi:hypothetical protein